MPRFRPRKKQEKTSESIPPKQASVLSPEADAILQRFADLKTQDREEFFIRMMVGSSDLADEPEFNDLYFDEEKTLNVFEKWLRKYEKRLSEAEKKSEEEFQLVYDEIRIEAIDELVTPHFRKEVKERIQALKERLMEIKDLEKLEITLFLDLILSTKNLTWGICGLILEIYDRTRKIVMKNYEEQEDIFESFIEAVEAHSEIDFDVNDFLMNPHKYDEITLKVLEEQPDLQGKIEERISEIVDGFEEAIMQGKVDLKLFSDEELIRIFQTIQEEEDVLTNTRSPEERSKVLFETIQLAFSQMMDQERYRQFREDIEATLKTWVKSGQEWAAALQAELDYLDETHYEPNSFMLMVFMGQIYRFGRKKKITRKQKK